MFNAIFLSALALWVAFTIALPLAVGTFPQEFEAAFPGWVTYGQGEGAR